MKRIAALLVFALGTAAIVSTQESNLDKEMTGVLCDEKCVTQDAGKSACDLGCTEKTGQAVFVEDSGKATKVANPEVCKGKMGKKVKLHGKMMKDSNSMYVHDVIFANAG